MSQSNRRYDIDWLRVIAIGLLLLYHTAIGFQTWGIMVGFIATDKSWGALMPLMTMLNIWRIPLLFFVSGMGIYFSSQNRNWKQLLLERTSRILLPFLFGVVFIVPIHQLLWQYYYKLKLSYTPGPGHLWFLGNISVYVLVLSPVLFYLKNNKKLTQRITIFFSTPFGLIPVIAAFIAEAIFINPKPYELYAMTWHGFSLGALAFFFGFCFALSGASLSKMIVKWRWFFLPFAATLFIARLLYFHLYAPNYMVAIESVCWVISVLAFGLKYLNRPGKTLSYLSQAAYPVYIMHMIFLYLGSIFIFPLNIDAPLQFVLILAFTFAGCLLFYEFVARRINIIRPLFGLKANANNTKI